MLGGREVANLITGEVQAAKACVWCHVIILLALFWVYVYIVYAVLRCLSNMIFENVVLFRSTVTAARRATF